LVEVDSTPVLTNPREVTEETCKIFISEDATSKTVRAL
jgi:hypothetical protein